MGEIRKCFESYDPSIVIECEKKKQNSILCKVLNEMIIDYNDFLKTFNTKNSTLVEIQTTQNHFESQTTFLNQEKYSKFLVDILESLNTDIDPEATDEEYLKERMQKHEE